MRFPRVTDQTIQREKYHNEILRKVSKYGCKVSAVKLEGVIWRTWKFEMRRRYDLDPWLIHQDGSTIKIKFRGMIDWSLSVEVMLHVIMDISFIAFVTGF